MDFSFSSIFCRSFSVDKDKIIGAGSGWIEDISLITEVGKAFIGGFSELFTYLHEFGYFRFAELLQLVDQVLRFVL